MTEKLFETALGITVPWYVADAYFNAQARALTIRVDFKSGSRFAVASVEANIRSTIRCPNATGI